MGNVQSDDVDTLRIKEDVDILVNILRKTYQELMTTQNTLTCRWNGTVMVGGVIIKILRTDVMEALRRIQTSGFCTKFQITEHFDIHTVVVTPFDGSKFPIISDTTLTYPAHEE